jgi:uncharacterized membrane-anchored protein
MQGDYMRLDYAIARQIGGLATDWPATGQIVVRLDATNVAHFVRRRMPGEQLAPGEHALTYRRRDWRLRIGTDAFHFQEGEAERYRKARYGELRVSRSGETVLIGLRDSARARLGRTIP